MNISKSILSILTVLLFWLPSIAIAVPAIPQNVELEATSDSITVNWEAVSNASGYRIYWSTSDNISKSSTQSKPVTNSAAGLTGPITVGDEASFTLGDSSDVIVDAGTKYYVALTAYDSDDDESSFTSSKSITTEEATLSPARPINFVTTDRTTASVSIKWENGNGADVDEYDVTVEKSTDTTDPRAWTTVSLSSAENPTDLTVTNTTISGLTANTRYRFGVVATNSDGDSGPTYLVVDTFSTGNTYDTLAPFPPTNISPVLLDNLRVQLNFTDHNVDMADLSEYKVYYGVEIDNLTNEALFTPTEQIIISGLEADTSYTFKLSALDNREDAPNESAQSTSTTIFVEQVQGLLENNDGIEGGCFIESSASQPSHSFLIILGAAILAVLLLRRRITGAVAIVTLVCLLGQPVASEALETPVDDNTVYIKGGALFPSDDLHKDVYDENEAFLTIGYQRHLFWGVQAGIEAGYSSKEGKKRTVSGNTSGEDVSLILVPISASLTWDVAVADEVTLFAGGGLDYWYYRESSKSVTVDSKDHNYGVGGYHGRFGVKLFTRDPQFYHSVGILLEGVYSVIDRFGDNDLDLGGWSANAGIIYTY